MKTNQNPNRRNWLKLSFGLAAGTVGTAFIKTDKDTCALTPRQELGPFPTMKFRSQADHDIDLTQLAGQTEKATGEVIVVQGKVLNTACQPIAGAIVEIWQANHQGKYRHEFDDEGKSDPNFQGWGQAITNARGEYRFKTIIPGLYGRRTRHIHYKVSKRGYHELITQLYFEGEERNLTDGILNSFTHEEQMQLIGKLDRTAATPAMTFNISLDAVQVGALPNKVLTEYVGNYDLAVQGKGYESVLKNYLGGPFEKVTVSVSSEGGLLYLTTTNAPKAELFWKAKDHFDAAAFYDRELFFIRDATGKVSGLKFRSKKGEEMTGTRV